MLNLYMDNIISEFNGYKNIFLVFFTISILVISD
jgi:hypothetical protein